jgi:hypothetical protein
MTATVSPSAPTGAKLIGRPVPPAIALIEAIVEEIAHEQNKAEKLARTIDFLAHLRVVGGRLESELMRVVRDIYSDEIPTLKGAAGIAEALYHVVLPVYDTLGLACTGGHKAA